MSVLTTIGGIPLFSTQEEAVQWGLSVGLQNFHTHIYAGQTGYMAGDSHNQATSNQGINGEVNGEVNGETINPGTPSTGASPSIPSTPSVGATQATGDY
jgi:hypothetical protein